ncbi:MAG: hypothetical protein FWF41_04850 [Betaproteobacteria bacterium]|nr:hypothetical protein [Betaproteobacteria bacterium]
MKDNHEQVVENRAVRVSNLAQENSGQCCNNHLLFAMRDNHHEFTLGVTTVLECVWIAEQQGFVPELPNEWWHQIINHYNLSLPHLKK